MRSEELEMKTGIIVGMLSLTFCAWADNFQACAINGAPVTCGLDNVGTGTIGGNDAYKLYLTDVGSDFADLYMTGINAKLANTTGTFQAYVPGASTNGAYASLEPYMYFTVNPYGTNFAGGDPYALVLVADSGFGNFVNDKWYQDGISLASTVHIVLGNGWTAAEAGITNSDWLTCCGDLPTLGNLLSVVIPAAGAEPAMTWGDTSVYKARVAAGNWGGSGGPYTAYVGNMDLVSTPEPGSVFLLITAVSGCAVTWRRKVLRKERS